MSGTKFKEEIAGLGYGGVESLAYELAPEAAAEWRSETCISGSFHLLPCYDTPTIAEWAEFLLVECFDDDITYACAELRVRLDPRPLRIALRVARTAAFLRLQRLETLVARVNAIDPDDTDAMDHLDHLRALSGSPCTCWGESSTTERNE